MRLPTGTVLQGQADSRKPLLFAPSFRSGNAGAGIDRS